MLDARTGPTQLKGLTKNVKMWLCCAQVTSIGQMEVTEEHWPESRKTRGEKMVFEWFVAWERWAV